MFCPSCGTECPVGLNYCNRCGANLSALTTQPEIVHVNLTKPALIIGAILAVFTLGGFGALIGGALALAPVVKGSDPLIAMIFLGMMIILVVDIFLVRQLTKLINASIKSDSPPSLKRPAAQPQTVPQLPRLSTAQLTPAPSVTEHTTRFFEPAYRSPAEAGDPAAREELKK